ncbi:MAG: GDP-L-fucose synthase [Candidatus Omnitrophica bacterium]|nr:GDP-L-fucose synthase [Candidatus Omnitrophota bacterium]MDD5652682.1 GDP-L-fucose synthase [Candidatus Omnitrophota bacterium]
MDKDRRIFVAGHKGMVGSAILRALKKDGYENVILANRQELDLRDETAVREFFKEKKPEYVFLAAARVGGIKANMSFPAEFLRDNLMIQNNVIHYSYISGVKKLIFLGSSCIYPRDCQQPIKEEYLFTGPLEPTNEGYALAKIAGLRMVQYYFREHGLKSICLMPCNLYGPNDNFDPESSHFFPALVKKFVDACDNNSASVTLWGTGNARRDLMHVDDLVRALFFLLGKLDSPEIINISSGQDVSIRELAELIARKVDFKGNIIWDTKMPDGMPRKYLDITKLRNLGFQSQISLEDGVSAVIAEYRKLKNNKGEPAHE